MQTLTTIAKEALLPLTGLAKTMAIYRILSKQIEKLYENYPALHTHRDVTLHLLEKAQDQEGSTSSEGLPTVVIAVGHSRKHDEGATTWDGSTSEHGFNLKIATQVCELLEQSGLVKPVLLSKYGGKTYSQAIKWLSDKVNSLSDVALVAELHFNSSSNNKATGHEFLYWHSSSKGAAIAQTFSAKMCETFPKLQDRGAKPIKKGERGSLFLRKLAPVCLLCEPFFGSNLSDWNTFKDQKAQRELATSYFEAIIESVLS